MYVGSFIVVILVIVLLVWFVCVFCHCRYQCKWLSRKTRPQYVLKI